MNLLRRLVGAVRGFVRRVRLVLSVLFGEPLAAARRVLHRVRDRIDALIDRFSAWWRELWGAAPKEDRPEGDRPEGRRALVLVAAAVCGVGGFVVPWRRIWDVTPGDVALGFGVVAVLVVVSGMVATGRPTRVAGVLEDIEQRVGTVWYERITLLVAGYLAYRASDEPDELAFSVLALVGALTLLGRRFRTRELHDHPPFVPPMDLEPSGSVVTYTWSLRVGDVVEDADLTVAIDPARLDAARADNPGHGWTTNGLPQFERWVEEGLVPEVDQAAAQLARQAIDRGYSPYLEIANVLAFVQSIPYSLDEDSAGQQEYWRYPIETLADGTGDCEDTTILAATILHRMGHHVGIFEVPGHVALAVSAPIPFPGSYITHKGRTYYYCETTAEGWSVGELPPEQDRSELTIRWVSSTGHPTDQS